MSGPDQAAHAIHGIDYAKHLNQEQLDVIENGDGCALVVAGPGSGKTRTLVYRVAKLLEQGEDPQSILLLTFTNKAAREMRGRVESLVGAKASGMTAGTFHHFANILLRRHHGAIGLERNFTILDDEDSKALVRKAALEEHDKVKKGIVDDIARAHSLARLRMQPLEEILQTPEYFHLRGGIDEILAIAQRYEAMKRTMNVVDFDDLLVGAHQLLKDETIRSFYQKRFRNILVDEFQDTDRLQSAIIRQLHMPGNNLMVVGDDSQSIYSFRGADISNILSFRELYSAKVFFLIRNYRSTHHIVDLVNGCIAGSKMRIEKRLIAEFSPDNVRPGAKKPVKPSLFTARDRVEEAKILADRIEARLKEGVKVGVLFRSTYLAAELEVDLAGRGIQYDLRGGVRFFEQRHIKDMLSLVKAYENPRDSASVMRLLMLFPRVGEKGAMKASVRVKKPMDLVGELASIDKGGALSQLIGEIFASGEGGANAARMLDRFYTGFYKKYMEENFENHEERAQDIDALVGAAARFPSLSEFLESYSLDPESPKGKDHQLVLSTIHQAKGLEWDSVFIMGLADGMLPSARASDLEEERRLFYVAASRARHELVMSYPLSSGRFYEFEQQRPSRFLLELPQGCFDIEDPGQSGEAVEGSGAMEADAPKDASQKLHGPEGERPS